MTKYRLMFADVRLTGTRDQIRQTLSLLASVGCEWKTDDKYYPRGKLESAYYLHKFRGPLLDTESPPAQPIAPHSPLT
ncbi:hypothetical protein HC766_09245 [Candidatus Gracilibacteria bacterium]|nr:hypothetical protein [Candidatus Gracilibacteria bacterium]